MSIWEKAIRLNTHGVIKHAAESAEAHRSGSMAKATTQSGSPAVDLFNMTVKPFTDVATKGVGALWKSAVSLQVASYIKRLDGSNPTLAGDAARALVKLGTAAVPQLSACLYHKDRGVREWADFVLGEIGPSAMAAAPELINRLYYDNRNVSDIAHTAITLGKIRAKTAIPHLIKCLNDKDAYVRAHCAKALGMMGPVAQAAVPQLIQCLFDKFGPVNDEAARALGKMGQAAFPQLITCLNDGNSNVRYNAAEALGMMGSAAKAAIPHLIRCLYDKAWPVPAAAERALAKITKKT